MLAEKIKALLANFHKSPVTTALGWISGGAAWLALRPELNHPTWQTAGSIALAAGLAIWGSISKDSTGTPVPKP